MLKRLLYALILIAFHFLFDVSWLFLVKFSVVMVLFVYITLPLMYHFFPTIPRHLVFLPFLRWPRNQNFRHPEEHGLLGTRNFYLTTDDGIQLGVWHILPQEDIEEAVSVGAGEPDTTFYMQRLRSGAPIIFYNHGNSGSRAGPHRVELYQVLRRMGYHVVCFDYRGYADSSNVPPSETGVVSDSRFMYKWLRRHAPSTALIVWGHSLGTGVTSHMVAELCAEGDRPTALVLESPFNNIMEEVTNHKLSTIYRKMPFFRWLILEPLITNDMAFESDRHIGNITVPILIMHAEDDLIIPFQLAVKLHDVARRIHPPEQLQFEKFEADFHYGHKYICRSPRLPTIVSGFIQKAITWNQRQKH